MRAPTSTATTNPACNEAGVICTVAGTGNALYDGDGKPALQTSFYFPRDVNFDSTDRALILDFNNLRLRRLNTNGTIETIMGTGSEEFPDDGALAKNTPLHHASDVELDTGGNLYVAGYHVPVVFRVGTDNRVFTVAGTTEYGNSGDGGPARAALLSEPFGVLPDSSGGFYISDIAAHVLRYVDQNNVITTLAGQGHQGYSGDGGPAVAAELAAPARLALDAAGNLYFTEINNHIIRRLDVGRQISTFAGTGRRGYTGDGGPANRAQLNSPYALRFAPNGALYVADTGNNVIRRIDRDGIVTTIAGTGEAGFSGDGADARAARLNRPSGIEFDAGGNLWVADEHNHRVRRIAKLVSPAP